jgi:hypothetical protein
MASCGCASGIGRSPTPAGPTSRTRSIESDGTWRWQVTLVERTRRTRLEANGSTEPSMWIAHIKRALATSDT